MLFKRIATAAFTESESHSSNFLQTNCGILCSFTKILILKLKLRTSIHNINIWMKWIMDELRPRCTLGWTLLAVSCEMCECSQVGTSAPGQCRHTVTLHHTPGIMRTIHHAPTHTQYTPTTPPRDGITYDLLRYERFPRNSDSQN